MSVQGGREAQGGDDSQLFTPPHSTLPRSQEAAAAPAVVVANRSSVDDYVASRSAGQPACLSPAKHTPTHTAATAVALDSPWLRSCLDTFGDVRTRVLAARDAATPDPLSPSFATAAPPPPLPPLPSSPDTATWPPGPASARGLAATPQPTILAALVAVADACGDGQPPLPAPAARWAHALAANLEKPLPSPAAAALARMATAAGADAAAARGDADRAARAAVVAAVAGGWFGQCASLAAAARVD